MRLRKLALCLRGTPLKKSLGSDFNLGMLESHPQYQIMNFENLPSNLSSQLQNLTSGTILLTPDRLKSRHFSILGYRADALYVETQGGTEMRLPLQAFVRTLRHMYESGSSAYRPALIRSSNLEPPLGGLCDISRGANGETRWITYILPVLQYLRWVHVNGAQRPNTAWLASPA